MAFRRRLLLLLLVATAGVAVVWTRVFVLQVVDGDDAVRRAQAATRRTEPLPGRRGRILDATGAPLAHDVAVPRLVFLPSEWATRERFRCRRCGSIAFARTPRHFDSDRPVVAPRACACGAKRGEFDPVPPEDLAPLEAALHLPPGTLEEAAEERMAVLRRRVAVRTVSRVLGASVGFDARVKARAEAVQARLGVSDESSRRVAIDEVLAELEPALEERSFEAADVRAEERIDRYGRPIVWTSFPGPAGARIEVKRISDEAERLLELDRVGRYRGLRTEIVRDRVHPRRGLLAQVIGLTSPFESEGELERFRARFGADAALLDTPTGRTGLEARYDDRLRGEPGRIERRRGDSGAFTETTVERAPTRGEDVVLHADAAACEEAWRILRDAATDEGYAGDGAANGAFVGLDAETGHVLWWAETPVFDLDGSLDEITTRVDDGNGGLRGVVPADPGPGPGDEPAAFTPKAPRPALTLSRVARIAVEPGSAIKPWTALVLRHSGHEVPAAFACRGRAASANDKPGCHASHGTVDLVEMLRASCNRYCAGCAGDRERLGLHRVLFPNWARTCGLGVPTEIDLPSEGSGSVPRDPDGARLRQISIGQGITATPLQMARLMCLFANGRRLPTPRLVARVGDEPVADGAFDVDLDPSALADIRRGMRACAETGTAEGRFLGKPGLEGVTVYGKTGTAEAGSRDWEAEGEDITTTNGPWHLWFVGYATKPGTRTVAFAAVIHARRDGAGGSFGAPIVQRFLSWWYAR